MKIRSLSIGAKTYIVIEVVDGKKSRVKVDRVDGRDFITNDEKFMYYYFLDGILQAIDVFVPMYPY